MGELLYGPTASSITIDDRVLAHLQAVIVSKFRRNECFTFTWERTTQEDSGRSTVWLHASMYIEFVFTSAKRTPLNREWIERLVTRANSAAGLELMPEPQPGR